MTNNTPEQAFISILSTGVDIGRRTIYIMGEVAFELAYRFIPAIKMLDETEGDIKVIINSVGGDEASGYAMFDAIMMTKNKVIAEGYGQVSSIASAIFQAADERLMAPGCELMIHNGSIGVEEEIKQDHIMELADSIRRGNKRYHTILSDNSHYTMEKIQELCKQDTYLTAKEAVEAGLADGILGYVKKKRRLTKKKRNKK